MSYAKHPEGLWLCGNCHEMKDVKNFPKRVWISKKEGQKISTHSICYPCGVILAKKWATKNRERFNKYQNNYNKTKRDAKKNK